MHSSFEKDSLTVAWRIGCSVGDKMTSKAHLAYYTKVHRVGPRDQSNFNA